MHAGLRAAESQTQSRVRAVCGLASCWGQLSHHVSDEDEAWERCRVELHNVSLGKGCVSFTPLCSFPAVPKPSEWHTELPTWHQLAVACAGGCVCQRHGTRERGCLSVLGERACCFNTASVRLAPGEGFWSCSSSVVIQ